jgi:hypothetical protein
MSDTNDFAESAEVSQRASSEGGVDGGSLGDFVVDLDDVETVRVGGTSNTKAVIREGSPSGSGSRLRERVAAVGTIVQAHVPVASVTNETCFRQRHAQKAAENIPWAVWKIP